MAAHPWNCVNGRSTSKHKMLLSTRCYIISNDGNCMAPPIQLRRIKKQQLSRGMTFPVPCMAVCLLASAHCFYESEIHTSQSEPRNSSADEAHPRSCNGYAVSIRTYAPPGSSVDSDMFYACTPPEQRDFIEANQMATVVAGPSNSSIKGGLDSSTVFSSLAIPESCKLHSTYILHLNQTQN